jgi:hypothetical protein
MSVGGGKGKKRMGIVVLRTTYIRPQVHRDFATSQPAPVLTHPLAGPRPISVLSCSPEVLSGGWQQTIADAIRSCWDCGAYETLVSWDGVGLRGWKDKEGRMPCISA